MTIKTKPQTKEYDESYDKIFGIPLWKLKRKQRVRFPSLENREVFFDHVDGAYSFCIEDGGAISHYDASLKAVPLDE